MNRAKKIFGWYHSEGGTHVLQAVQISTGLMRRRRYLQLVNKSRLRRGSLRRNRKVYPSMAAPARHPDF